MYLLKQVPIHLQLVKHHIYNGDPRYCVLLQKCCVSSKQTLPSNLCIIETALTSATQVGNTIFQVPRNGFEVPGTIFETMFSLPPATVEGGVEHASRFEGSSDDNPIVLPVDENHFRGLLGAMYPFR